MIINRKNERRLRRKKGVRKRILLNSDRYRLTVYRSLGHIYAQIIDDSTHATLVSACTIDKEVRQLLEGVSGKIDQSRIVGKVLAERAAKAQVSEVVFDRNGFVYHGRIKALAEGAREGGLQF